MIYIICNQNYSHYQLCTKLCCLFVCYKTAKDDKVDISWAFLTVSEGTYLNYMHFSEAQLF